MSGFHEVCRVMSLIQGQQETIQRTEGLTRHLRYIYSPKVSFKFPLSVFSHGTSYQHLMSVCRPDCINKKAARTQQQKYTRKGGCQIPIRQTVGPTVGCSSPEIHFLKVQGSSSQTEKDRKIFNCKQSCSVKCVKRHQSAFLKLKFISTVPVNSWKMDAISSSSKQDNKKKSALVFFFDLAGT